MGVKGSISSLQAVITRSVSGLGEALRSSPTFLLDAGCRPRRPPRVASTPSNPWMVWIVSLVQLDLVRCRVRCEVFVRR